MIKENIPDPHARLGRVPVPESQTKNQNCRVEYTSLASAVGNN